jgi:hypothetical protein
MLTIASDREFDERNEQIRTSPTPLLGASNLPSVRKSTEVTLILHQQRRFVRGQSTHLRSDGLVKKIGFHFTGTEIPYSLTGPSRDADPARSICPSCTAARPRT